MSIIIKTGDTHILNPTNISHGNLTILQNAFLRFFPNTTNDYFRLLRTKPGEEITMFHSLLTPDIVIRDDRGIAIMIGPDMDPVNPPENIILAIIRSLAISYEEASRRSQSLRDTILNIKPKTDIYYIDNFSTSLGSFLYDGHKKESTGRLVRVGSSKNIIQNAIERAQEAIRSQETMALRVLTPIEAQNDIVELLMDKLKMDVIEEDGDWKMELNTPVNLSKLYPYAFLINRGFIRATYPNMLLPDNAPNHIIRHIENIGVKIGKRQGGKISSFEGETPTSVEMREYVKVGDDLPVAPSSIRYVSPTNPYEMRSAYQFKGFRPKLMPVI